MIIPSSDRYGVMLKTISEEFLPKRIQIVTKPITEAEGEFYCNNNTL